MPHCSTRHPLSSDRDRRPRAPAFWLRHFLNDRNGGTLVMFALSMPILFGLAAFVVDYARGSAMRQSLENAADAAALAAVTRLPDDGDATKTALEYVEKNMPKALYGDVLKPQDVEIGTWDAATRTFTPVGPDGTGSAVRVTARLSATNGNAINTLFATVFGAATMEISASAVAGRRSPPCIIALEPTAAAAMQFTGSSELEAIGCGVQVNSTATEALSMKGSSQLEATSICVGGTSSTGGKSSATPSPNEFCPGSADPLAGHPMPTVGACNHNDATYNNASVTLGPGVYCGGLTIKGNSNVTLTAGTYIMKDGPFVLQGQATVTGDEVTLFLTGSGAVVNMAAKTTLNVTAPLTGDMAGILFFQDPNFGGVHDWKGKSATKLRGVIYFPNGTLASKNDNAITPEDSCTVLIARELAFLAKSGATVDTSSSGCRNNLPGPYRRGVTLLE